MKVLLQQKLVSFLEVSDENMLTPYEGLEAEVRPPYSQLYEVPTM